MAVGDGGNDLAMLSGVTAAGGLGVAMANAVPAVRRVIWLGAAKAAMQRTRSVLLRKKRTPRDVSQVMWKPQVPSYAGARGCRGDGGQQR